MPAADAGQLPFPFALGTPPSPVAVEPVGRPIPPAWRTRLALGARSVIVTSSRSRDGAAVKLEAEQNAPGAWSIGLDLRLRPILAATIQSDSPEPLHWALSGRAPGADPREFFSYALRWATRKLAGESRARGRVLTVEAALRAVLRRASADLVGAVEPGLRATTLRFVPETRSRVASALARDPRGWLGEAARAHPGIVLFALGLFGAEETEEAGLGLLHGLAEGRRLGPAVDAAVVAWAAALPAWTHQLDLWPRPIRGAFAAAAELAGEPRARMLAAQKVLVRRAGPWCDPAVLLVPPPLRFAPEDVPGAPRANAAWFRVMKVPGVTVEGRPAAAQPVFAQAFASFASRHAVALARAPRGIPMDVWLGELCEVLRASGRTPARDTDPARLVARVDVAELPRRPPAQLPPLVAPAPVREAEPRRAPALPPVPVVAEPVAAVAAPRRMPRPRAANAPRESVTISPPTFPPWTTGTASVVQITTLRELREEGARMRNCVVDYRWMIERGDLVVFSARVEGCPITIAISRWMGGWRLSEWKGFANRTLRRSELQALRPWLEANRISDSWTAR